jgi:RecG-like helicase
MKKDMWEHYYKPRITKEQMRAIKRISERDDGKPYRVLRRLVQGTVGCDGAVALPIWGMWLCIERDGYTHS